MRALITGITGMDGRHLVDELLAQGDQVYGLIRDPDSPKACALSQRRGVSLVVGDLTDQLSIMQAIDTATPDVIYHLGAMSSPGSAWSMPIACGEITGLGTARVLQAVEYMAPETRVVVAGSIATHGPYGAAKSYARAMAEDFRQRGLDVVTMMMGGHHSPLRGRSYFSQKAAYAAAVARDSTLRSADGRGLPRARFGALTRVQDWGYAPDFMRVWARTAPILATGEYTLSTGEPHSVSGWLHQCFVHVGLDWHDWVDIATSADNPNLTDVDRLSVTPSEALNFKQSVTFDELVGLMVDAAYGEITK